MGHDTLAEACSATLEADGWSTRTLDLMRLLGRGADSIGERRVPLDARVPGVFDAFHFAALRTGNRLAGPGRRGGRRQIVPRLRGLLDANAGRPRHLGVRDRRLGGQPARRPVPGDEPRRVLHRRRPRTGSGCTRTSTCTWSRPMWPSGRCAGSSPTPGFWSCRPRCGQRSTTAPPQQPARPALGIPEHERCVLLMSGAWGIGPGRAGRRGARERRRARPGRRRTQRQARAQLHAAARRQPRVARSASPTGSLSSWPPATW